jgi:hypothetical protein
LVSQVLPHNEPTFEERSNNSQTRININLNTMKGVHVSNNRSSCRL